MISRSSHELFDQCKRKGYWGSIYWGGLETSKRGWPLVVGLAVHSGMEYIMRSLKVDGNVSVPIALEVIEGAFFEQVGDAEGESFSCLQNLALSKALVLGWVRTRMQRFYTKYRIVSVEKEVRTLLAPNVTLQSRCDVVVQERADNSFWVINWKTAKDIKDWTSKWEDDIQNWTEALATQEHLGVDVKGCIFEGFYKGTEYNSESTNRLVTGYRLPDGTYTIDHKKKGAVKFFPWIEEEFPGGLEGWINFLDEETVEKYYITSHPILKNDEQVRLWLKQVVREENDIESILDPDVEEEDRLTFFKQHKGQRCLWCQFRPVCRGEQSIDDALESGLLVQRKDHHAQPEGEVSA